MAEDEFLPLILDERDGEKRRIILTGPDLPRDRSGWLRFGTTQRGRETWYPGSPEPTTQVLGPEPREVSFSGEFNSGRRRTSEFSPEELMAQLERLNNDGELVVVQYGPISKLCRWLEAEFQIHTLSHIFYSLRFKIAKVGSGPKIRIVKAVRDIPTVQQVLEAGRKMEQILSTLPAGLGTDRISRAREAVGRVLTAGQGVDAILSKGRTPGAILNLADARSALRQADTVGEGTRETLENVRALDWGGMSGGSFGLYSTAGIGALGAISQAFTLTNESLRLHGKVRHLAGETQQDALYVAAQGDTLRSIAQRFYRAPDRWRQIAAANGLETSEVTPGTRLTIPKVGVGQEIAP